MLHFLTDNIFILLGGCLFQRTIVIPKGRNRVPILADLFLHVYEAFCLERLLKNTNIKLVQTFISSFRCIDDVLSLNNSRFGDYLHRIYPNANPSHWNSPFYQKQYSSIISVWSLRSTAHTVLYSLCSEQWRSVQNPAADAKANQTRLCC